MAQSKFIIGVAGLFGVIAAIWMKDQSVSVIIYWCFIDTAFGLFIALILVAIPEITLLIDRTFTEHVKLRFERRDPAIPLIAPQNRPVDAPPNPIRTNQLAAWIEYWIKALEYAETEGGVSFSRMWKFFGNDWVTWRKCFAEPMARWGQFDPIKDKTETVTAPGLSVQKIRWKLESGFRPDVSHFPSFVPPAHFERSIEANREAKKEAENTEKIEKIGK